MDRIELENSKRYHVVPSQFGLPFFSEATVKQRRLCGGNCTWHDEKWIGTGKEVCTQKNLRIPSQAVSSFRAMMLVTVKAAYGGTQNQTNLRDRRILADDMDLPLLLCSSEGQSL